ncbi:MAG: DUF2520 domain-containing protein [Saprospiraceae bacterium]|nr:DUF2520 domain-containing protein [Pyrinomonadaceae bacterium]
MDMQSVSIIGVGRIGGALALALSRAGYRVINLVYRNAENLSKVVQAVPQPTLISSTELADLRTDIIFITAPDPEIESIADQLSTILTGTPIVLHTSGSLSSIVLSKLVAIGCNAGSIHPLLSVSDPFRGAERFAGAYFCVEGDDQAVSAAKKIASDLGGAPFTIETRLKPLYHASAVTACGHLVALIDIALEMLAKCGVESEQGSKMLLPLIRSTVENLQTQTTAQALTGTFARADVAAFNRHLGLLRENVSIQAHDIYLDLGLRSLALAERQGADIEDIELIRKEIAIAKLKTG